MNFREYLKEASISDIDIYDPKDAAFQKLVKKFGVTIKIDKMRGPGGGSPNATISAKTKDNLVKFLSAIGYDDLSDDIKD